jgi:hypothetical protein
MVIGSAAMDELGWRLLLGQHSLFFLSAATVLSEAGHWQDLLVDLSSHTIDAGQPGDASN